MTRPIAGYRALSENDVENINRVKIIEERALRMLDDLDGLPGTNMDNTSLARVYLQQSVMWAVRAIAKPSRISLPQGRISLPEDGE